MVAQRQIDIQVSSHTEQLAPNMALIERLLAELRAENDEILEENRKFRARIAYLENELDIRTEDRDRKDDLIKWTRKLFANKTVPMACKLVLWYFNFAFFCMRPETTGYEMRIGVEDAAEALGISKSTVKRSTDKAENFDVLTRRYEDVKFEDGSKITLAHITLSDVVATPDSILMEKEQGGKRQKGCRVDGTPLNAYTVRHCPAHGEISVYGQPGNPKGANHDIMIDDFLRFYQDRIPYALDKKQDAFGGNEPAPAEMIDAQPSEPVRINSQVSQMQDALTNSEPIAETISQEIHSQKQDEIQNDGDQAHHILADRQQLDAEHSKPKTAASCIEHHYTTMEQHVTVCHAQQPLNKNGEPAHGLDKWVSYRECGSTQWQWSESDQARICAKCWTPQPE
jgi:hypothetical protein